MNFSCPCCGFKTFRHPPDGSYDICGVCFWEDDPLQLEDPYYEGGANGISLVQAQKNFREFGACARDMLPNVRKPAPDEQRDENWRPYEEVFSKQPVTIDLENIASPVELHQLFKEQLQFPDFYGGTWDAFWDAITGLTSLPNPLLISGFKSLKESLPRDAAILEELVREYNNIGISEIKLQ